MAKLVVRKGLKIPRTERSVSVRVRPGSQKEKVSYRTLKKAKCLRPSGVMAATPDLGSGVERRESSSLSLVTKKGLSIIGLVNLY